MATAWRISGSLLCVTISVAVPLRATPMARAITDEDVAAFTHTAPAEDSAAPAPAAGDDASGATGCSLSDPRSDQATSQSCVRCHVHRQSHPYDLDYANAAAAQRSGYAPAEQVVRAGVLLPDGEIRCVTCHDRRSPWKYKIALPPGATASPSVTARMRDGTFERPGALPEHLLPGSEVTPTPLCKVCHQF